MDADRRTQINRLADRIRRALELTAYPIDVEAAVGRLNGNLCKAPLGDPEAKIRKAGAGFIIELAGTKPKKGSERRRFSIAHELGHLFLHMGYLIAPQRWNAIDEYQDSPLHRFGFSEEEYEAHEFAGAFLMPKHEFQRIAYNFKSGDSYNVVPIAEHFGVSVPAAATRGRWLNLFAWP